MEKGFSFNLEKITLWQVRSLTLVLLWWLRLCGDNPRLFLPACRGIQASVAVEVGRIRKYFSLPHTGIEGTTVLHNVYCILYLLHIVSSLVSFRHLKNNLTFWAAFWEEKWPCNKYTLTDLCWSGFTTCFIPDFYVHFGWVVLDMFIACIEISAPKWSSGVLEREED